MAVGEGIRNEERNGGVVSGELAAGRLFAAVWLNHKTFGTGGVVRWDHGWGFHMSQHRRPAYYDERYGGQIMVHLFGSCFRVLKPWRTTGPATRREVKELKRTWPLPRVWHEELTG